MELKVVNDQGQQTATLAAADTVFGREYNEALVHQIVVAYQANARLGTRAQLTREAVHHSTRKPWQPERHRRCTCRYVFLSGMARRRQSFPQHTR